LEGNLRPLKEEYASLFAGRFPQRPLKHRSGRPLIGIVVTRTHEGIFLKSMRGVLERLPRDVARMAIICPQASMEMIRGGINRELEFIPLPRSLHQVEQQLHDAAIDVLYYWEIGTDATNYFLPFLRLAPVQCTSWGVQVTSGIPNVDYYLSNSLVEPPSAQDHYSERLLLAGTLLTYQFRDTYPSSQKPREAFKLSPHQHVYLCGQQLGKFHPEFDETLGEILRRDPRGVLAVIEDRHPAAKHLLQARWRRVLPDVVDRMFFLPRQERPDYVSLIQTADVLLDPFNFGGVNTSYDAFTFGKPVVTLPSGYHRGRYTLGCYKKMGISECVATDRESYVQLAVAMGTDPNYRRQVEREVEEASHVLFEDAQAVDEHARIFRELVEVSREQ
jgi:predicted O-linked N-acetylglucosamine transferase (SPINDLY family)